ncbi:hypothetical protein DPX16_8591 [Anabarilius grahami]|uniref:Uncharacterized protein n=1 Tax=Anabarilius grahami TaxID=495550 RepID=A0A3N0Y9D5_ANAGA|nr:hypothetical protein DPX16_8591 [Anabarilius grahami]
MGNVTRDPVSESKLSNNSNPYWPATAYDVIWCDPEYKGVPGETVSISSFFGPVLSDRDYIDSAPFVLRHNSGELVGKFEKVVFSLNSPGADEDEWVTMTFVFVVIASGGERSSGCCVCGAAVFLGCAFRRAAAAVRTL